MTPILEDTLDPPTIAANGLFGSSTAPCSMQNSSSTVCLQSVTDSHRCVRITSMSIDSWYTKHAQLSGHTACLHYTTMPHYKGTLYTSTLTIQYLLCNMYMKYTIKGVYTCIYILCTTIK